MNFFAKLLRGQHSLATTFWLCFFVPIVILNILLYVCGVFALRLSLIPYLYGALYYSLVAVSACVVYVCGFAVIKRAAKQKHGQMWAVFAGIAVAIYMVIFPYALINAHTNIGRANVADLDSKIGQLNSGLPVKIDAGTILREIALDDKTISYRFEISAADRNTIDTRSLRETALPSICNSYGAYFKAGALQQVAYLYSLSGREFSFSVSPLDCL